MPDYDPTVSTPRASDDSGTAPRQGRTITLPDFAGIKRITGQVSWARVIVVLALILLWSIASYEGWVIMPELGVAGGLFGGILLLIVPVGIVLFALVNNKIARLIAAVSAFIAGLIYANNYGSITGLFDGLTFSASLLTLVGLLVTLLILLWVCRKPAQTRPRQTRPQN